jgi:hypothetical protein
MRLRRHSFTAAREGGLAKYSNMPGPSAIIRSITPSLGSRTLGT